MMKMVDWDGVAISTEKEAKMEPLATLLMVRSKFLGGSQCRLSYNLVDRIDPLGQEI